MVLDPYSTEAKLRRLYDFNKSIFELEELRNKKLSQLKEDLANIKFGERRREIIKINRKIEDQTRTLRGMI